MEKYALERHLPLSSVSTSTSDNARTVAWRALQGITREGAYTDIALDRVLRRSSLGGVDRAFVSELVYGVVRRQRTLDALIDALGKKKAARQPEDLRLILHLGLYQLRYLDSVPPAAAVNTSVELAKATGWGKLSGVVNGILRQYLRLSGDRDPLPLPEDPVSRLGVLYSFPDWIVQSWCDRFGMALTEELCAWFNRPPTLHLRINPLRATRDGVRQAMAAIGKETTLIAHLPQALQHSGGSGAVSALPGYDAGWWSIQDGSAQLVSHLLAPRPGETIIDACAAPGGKTTHIAELMGDEGKIWALDRSANRLRRVSDNAERLRLNSIETRAGDIRQMQQQWQGDRVLVDAPCSGLGTLHKRPDLRWRQTPENAEALARLQQELLAAAATWVKPGGVLVYATCTLNLRENESVVREFLAHHWGWQLCPPVAQSQAAPFATPEGWIKIVPSQQQMDGFFMAKLSREGVEDAD